MIVVPVKDYLSKAALAKAFPSEYDLAEAHRKGVRKALEDTCDFYLSIVKNGSLPINASVIYSAIAAVCLQASTKLLRD